MSKRVYFSHLKSFTTIYAKIFLIRKTIVFAIKKSPKGDYIFGGGEKI